MRTVTGIGIAVCACCVAASAGAAAMATVLLLGVVDEIMALAASGANEVEASKDSTRRRRVMLSASLKSGVVNVVKSPSPSSLEVGIAVLVLAHDDVRSALLTLT